MSVRILEEHVVNQIAAGEVVERPASVVRELVQNALDAGARTIRVDLRDGGAARVRVVDDGSGMNRTDAMMALERHADSKRRRARECTMLDWLVLAGARAILTWGKQFSSFPKSASLGRCDVQRRRSPKKRPWDWRPRTFFLLHAMRQLRRKGVAAAECASDPAFVEAARGTPCQGLCTASECLDKIHRAYA